MVTNFLLFNSVVSSVSSPLRGVQPICFISFWPLSSADMLLFLKLSTQILLPCTFYVIYSILFSTRCWHVCHFSPLTDVNECLSAHACQLNQRCMNTVGSYVCQRLISCPPGYQIHNDICEGTAHFTGIKVAAAHSECAARISVVNMHAHNGRKAHCLVTQSCLPSQRAGVTNTIMFLIYSSLLWVCNVSFESRELIIRNFTPESNWHVIVLPCLTLNAQFWDAVENLPVHVVISLDLKLGLGTAWVLRF